MAPCPSCGAEHLLDADDAAARCFRCTHNPYATIHISMDAFPTRTMGGPGTKTPRYTGNPGVNPPTAQSLGLNPDQARDIGL